MRFTKRPAGSVSLVVTVNYADGDSEQHRFVNGEHFADYIREVDVPESRLAFRLRGQQLRYLQVEPGRSEAIESIEFAKARPRFRARKKVMRR